MPARLAGRAIIIVGVAGTIAFAFPVSPASAGEYSVASCRSDRQQYSTEAFRRTLNTFGMKVRRACNPIGGGLRGLVTMIDPNADVESLPVRSVSRIAVTAPPGTRMQTFEWEGKTAQSTCGGWKLSLFARVPGRKVPIRILNMPANTSCEKGGLQARAAYEPGSYDVFNATSIIQEVRCVGRPGGRRCTAKPNYILTKEAVVRLVDKQAPTVWIENSTPLARGEWVRGRQPIRYVASDNVGVRSVTAVLDSTDAGQEDWQCEIASPAKEPTMFATPTPCRPASGVITIGTEGSTDGTHSLFVRALDVAGVDAPSATVTVRVDNHAPSRVDLSPRDTAAWRTTNDFGVRWTNPPESDRAPIVGAHYRLCSVHDGACTVHERAGRDISGVDLAVPGPGVWTVAMWRRDEAGNADPELASVPVTLRYDPEAPQLTIDPISAVDPTLISVAVKDRFSGLATGSIEMSLAGSGVWQTLPTQVEASGLTARIDDAAMPAGSYLLRATAFDEAGNQGSTTVRGDGQTAGITLPLRLAAELDAHVVHERIEFRTERVGKKRRRVARRVTELLSTVPVRLGRPVIVEGRLTDPTGAGIASAPVQVLSTPIGGSPAVAGSVLTDAGGRFRYPTTGTTSRTLQFAFGGSPLILPAQDQVSLRVPAETTMRPNRTRVRNGQTVRFLGMLRTLPVGGDGKLVELQVLLSGAWQTFRTARTDATGRWAISYKFKRTTRDARFRFRAWLPREAGYPFEASPSPGVTVRVQGE